ncbi:MAG: alpha-amylase family glycosyl hydrolase, partial [Candidatus Heimdallarchaeota archaeon]
MKFWLDKGVDGFRIDMISWMGKDEQLRDNVYSKENGGSRGLEKFYDRDDPSLFDYLRLMRNLIDKYSGRVLIGEVTYTAHYEELKRYYGVRNDLIDIPANF